MHFLFLYAEIFIISFSNLLNHIIYFIEIVSYESVSDFIKRYNFINTSNRFTNIMKILKNMMRLIRFYEA